MAAAAPGGSAVVLRGLTKQYGRERVVDGFDAAIAPGEFFSLLGPSGSGKTTTLMMIAGFVAADAGTLLVAGRDLSPVPPQRRGFGMVFQNYAIFPHLNVFENVAFPLRARGMKPAAVAESVAWALGMVRLEAFGNRFSGQLSGGQQQRVAIARAIVFHPKVVLMDEPLGALDKNLRSEMQTEIRDIQQRLGMTVIYVTHDQEEAMNMSDRIAIMNRGRIEQIGAPRGVYEQPLNSFVGKFLGEANLLDGVVQEVRGDEASFRSAEGMLLRARTTTPVAPGAAARLFVRPENLSIVPARPGGSAIGTDANHVSGRVCRAAFLGSRLRCAVEVTGGALLTVDLPNNNGADVPEVGAAVSLAWPVAAGLVLTA